MTSYHKTVARSRGTGTGRQPTHRARSRVLMALGGAAVVAIAACSDSNIPFYTAPTSVPATPGGIQNALTGLFSASRIDINGFTITEAAGYARDGSVFTNTEPRTVTYPLGVQQTPNSSGAIWPQEYQNILQGQQIIAAIPSVAPTYSAAQAAALVGVTQTLIAINYMLVAEAHDTLGVAIRPAGNLSAPPPAYCIKNVWQYIVALLDSANTQFTAAGAITIPITLPVGYQGVKVAGPSTVAGTFASLNRALAAKANLELAYAINRPAQIDTQFSPDTNVVPTPDAGAIATAAADLAASGMYNEAQLAPNSPSGFPTSAYGVNWDFGPSSGDVTNPIFGQIGTEATLKDLIASVDTINDLRWKAKFIKNPNQVQQPQYNPIANFFCCANPTPWSYLYNMSSSPSSVIPEAREEGLVILNAQIMLAQGNYAGAIAKANLVRVQVGGLPAKVVAPTYIAARDFVLSEQRISLAWEPWAARTISLRMYGLALVADTTWNNPGPPPAYHLANRTQESAPQTTYLDWHTMWNPIPTTELAGRGQLGGLVLTCN
jgi:hypothetical protein